MTVRMAESCGTLATVTDALTRGTGRTALACPPFSLAIRLAGWVGDSRELTSTSVLRPAVAVQACQALGLALPVGNLRGAKDVFELARAWDAAVAADLVLVTANRACAAPDVADLARAFGGTVAPRRNSRSGRRLAARCGHAARVPRRPLRGVPDRAVHASEAAAPVELADLAAAVAPAPALARPPAFLTTSDPMCAPNAASGTVRRCQACPASLTRSTRERSTWRSMPTIPSATWSISGRR